MSTKKLMDKKQTTRVQSIKKSVVLKKKLFLFFNVVHGKIKEND